jgi:hypothetical protein
VIHSGQGRGICSERVTFGTREGSGQFSIDNVVECYGDLAELEWKFPVGSLIDDASHLP